jgi:hypothetical protein
MENVYSNHVKSMIVKFLLLSSYSQTYLIECWKKHVKFLPILTDLEGLVVRVVIVTYSVSVLINLYSSKMQ